MVAKLLLVLSRCRYSTEYIRITNRQDLEWLQYGIVYHVMHHQANRFFSSYCSLIQYVMDWYSGLEF